MLGVFFCAQEANDNASTLSALTETQSVNRGAEAQQHANISGGAGSAAGSTISNWHFCQHNFSSIKGGAKKVKDAILFDSQSTGVLQCPGYLGSRCG